MASHAQSPVSGQGYAVSGGKQSEKVIENRGVILEQLFFDLRQHCLESPQ
jgi:hypothetical protein